MGPKAEENYGQTIAENLMENILNEVDRSIIERADSCFDSFESLKLQTFGSEDILDYGCSRRDNCGTAKESECRESTDASCRVNDLCYPSLANLPEVCVHSSSMTKSSKQGEGDFQHPTIREAVAFYRLETGEEDNRPSGSKDFGTCCGSALVENLHRDAANRDTVQLNCSLEMEESGQFVSGGKECKNSCDSSLITETSYEELIDDLQRKINNASFDNIHLSDSDDDGSRGSRRSTDFTSTPFNCCSRDLDGCGCTPDDQGTKDAFDSPDEHTCLQQSKKFCQFNNVNFFPHNEMPSNYCQLVNESYDRYDSIGKEEDEQILVSDASSEELVIIESDEIEQITTVDSCRSQTNSCQNSLFRSAGPSTTMLSQFPSCSPGTSYLSADPPENSCSKITVVADLEPVPDHRNWEEALEVQVNVTEPMKSTEMDEKEDCDLVKTRKYWTSVGLMTDKNVDPTYVKLISDDTDGIESVPGMVRVRETLFTRDLRYEDEILSFEEYTERGKHNELDRNISARESFERTPKQDDEKPVYNQNYRSELVQSGEKISDNNKVNYLNLSAEAARDGKKKNKFVSRLTKSLTNLFRSKKRNPK